MQTIFRSLCSSRQANPTRRLVTLCNNPVYRTSRINSIQQQVRNQSSPTAAWPYIYRQHPSPNMAPQLDAYFQQVDTMAEAFIDRLAKAVAIPSVSADDDKREEVVRVSVSRRVQ